VISSDFMTFLRFITGCALLVALGALVTLLVFGLIDLRYTIWPDHPLSCVSAHDEFHQTDNGTQIRICDRYQRR
jgi:hypothetical protein